MFVRPNMFWAKIRWRWAILWGTGIGIRSMSITGEPRSRPRKNPDAKTGSSGLTRKTRTRMLQPEHSWAAPFLTNPTSIRGTTRCRGSRVRIIVRLLLAFFLVWLQLQLLCNLLHKVVSVSDSDKYWVDSVHIDGTDMYCAYILS